MCLLTHEYIKSETKTMKIKFKYEMVSVVRCNAKGEIAGIKRRNVEVQRHKPKGNSCLTAKRQPKIGVVYTKSHKAICCCCHI